MSGHLGWSAVMTTLLIALSSLSGSTALADDFAAMALIKNVKAARQATPPFKARCSLKRQRGQEPASEQRFTLEYDSLRYRIAAISDPKFTVIFDGERLCAFDGAHRCVIATPERFSQGLAFDPRLIGILPLYRPELTLDDRFAYRRATSGELAGSETIRDASTTKVRMVDRFGQTVTFWIEPQAPFRVHRYEVTVSEEQGGIASHTVVDSIFPEEASLKWMPQTVTVNRFKNPRDESSTATIILQLELPTTEVSFSKDTWTLAGLGLPAGQAVIDTNTQRVRVWNGTELVPIPAP